MVEELIEEDPELYDANDTKTVNNARKKEARFRQRRKNFVRQMMQDEDGRLWLYDLLEFCNIYVNPLAPGQTDVTFHNIGQANVGRKLLVDINEAAPELYMQLMSDGKNAK